MLAHTYRRDLDGYLIGNGSPYRLADLDVPGLVAYVWWFFTREAEESERTKFEARLWRSPPPSAAAEPIPAESPWSAEKEMSAFASLRAETGA